MCFQHFFVFIVLFGFVILLNFQKKKKFSPFRAIPYRMLRVCVFGGSIGVYMHTYIHICMYFCVHHFNVYVTHTKVTFECNEFQGEPNLGMQLGKFSHLEKKFL